MEDADRDVLQDRLAALEQTVAFQNRVGLVGLLSFMAVLSIGYLASRPSKNLVVDSIELRDKTGLVRSRFALAADDSPTLSMFDDKGLKLVTMGQTYKGSSALSFYDQGEPRMQLASISKGIAALRFMNDANETQGSVFVREDRGMGISLASSNEGLFFGLEPDGKPRMKRVDVNATKQGRKKLANEELERFSMPGKGVTAIVRPSTNADESKSAEVIQRPVEGDSNAAVVGSPNADKLAMNRQNGR